jgi:hypothetical protein
MESIIVPKTRRKDPAKMSFRKCPASKRGPVAEPTSSNRKACVEPTQDMLEGVDEERRLAS